MDDSIPRALTIRGMSNSNKIYHSAIQNVMKHLLSYSQQGQINFIQINNNDDFLVLTHTLIVNAHSI